MIEIIPNWHPIFVHFTIGLLFTSILLFLTGGILFDKPDLREQLWTVGRWNLWIGYAVALVTAFFGWLAYNSVTHDAASHEVMTVHRNWALTTLAIFLPVVLWSLFSYQQKKSTTWLFILVLVIGSLFLARTGWLGAELVYRHGLGVMSLPKADEHVHGESSQHTHEHDH